MFSFFLTTGPWSFHSHTTSTISTPASAASSTSSSWTSTISSPTSGTRSVKSAIAKAVSKWSIIVVPIIASTIKGVVSRITTPASVASTETIISASAHASRTILYIQHLVQFLSLHKEAIFFLTTAHTLFLFFHPLHHVLFFSDSTFGLVFHHYIHFLFTLFPSTFLHVPGRFSLT